MNTANITIRVVDLDTFARKYHLAQPDGLVGSPASRFVIDYGHRPVILADSSRPQHKG